MPPYYHPTYLSDHSSVEDPSSGEEDSYETEGVVRDDHCPTNIISRSVIDNIDHNPLISHININNNSLRPLFRANVGDSTSCGTQDQVDLTVFQPSQVTNANGNSTIHAMKGGHKLIGELYDTKNEVHMNAILREAAREGFAKTLCFPNRSKWLVTKVPIWFGSGGILGRLVFIVINILYYVSYDLTQFFYIIYFFCFLSFRSVDVKNFQSKFKRAEEQAVEMLLPGAHSVGDGTHGENIPEWVAIFQQYWEHKKSHPSKSAQEEQQREERRTMQRTILPPVQPLGGTTDQLFNETSSSRSHQLSSNSLIVESGSMAVVPVVNSTIATPRPVNSRHISTGGFSRRGSSSQASLVSASHRHHDMQGIMDAMNSSNRALFRRSYKEVLEDFDLVNERLVRARTENDRDGVELYNNLCKKLVDELHATT